MVSSLQASAAMLAGRRVCLALVLMSAAGAACDRRAGKSTDSTATASGAVTGRLVGGVQRVDDAGQWTMAAGDYASTRFSPLDEINAGNASRLKAAWTFSTGMLAGHEAAPLIVGSTMYLVTPFPNIVYALDLTKPGAPVKWRYDPQPLGAARGVACCDVVNRGVAFWNDSIIFNTLDARTISLDAGTGEKRWEAQLGDMAARMTMVGGKIVYETPGWAG